MLAQGSTGRVAPASGSVRAGESPQSDFHEMDRVAGRVPFLRSLVVWTPLHRGRFSGAVKQLFSRSPAERMRSIPYGPSQALGPAGVFDGPGVVRRAVGRIVPRVAGRFFHEFQRRVPHGIVLRAADRPADRLVARGDPIERTELFLAQHGRRQQLRQPPRPIPNHGHDASHAKFPLRSRLEDEARRDGLPLERRQSIFGHGKRDCRQARGSFRFAQPNYRSGEGRRAPARNNQDRRQHDQSQLQDHELTMPDPSPARYGVGNQAGTGWGLPRTVGYFPGAWPGAPLRSPVSRKRAPTRAGAQFLFLPRAC